MSVTGRRNRREFGARILNSRQKIVGNSSTGAACRVFFGWRAAPVLEFCVDLSMRETTEILVTTIKNKPCHFEQREKSAVGNVEQKQITHPMNLGSK
jgi:hypothetical protein